MYMKQKTKKTKTEKITSGWIDDLTEYEKSIFVNMLNEANISKRKELSKKERRVIMGKCRSIVQEIRKANDINVHKDEVDGVTHDVIQDAKDNKPKRIRMGWISDLTEDEKKIIDDFLDEANKLKGKKLNKREKQTVMFIARDQIRSLRRAKPINKSKRNGSNEAEKIGEESKTTVSDLDGYGRLQRISPAERDFLNAEIYKGMEVKGRRLVQSERREVLHVAREKILYQRNAAEIKRERDKERHAAKFEWKKPEPFKR